MQAEQGVSREAQEAKIRVMATVQGAELLDAIVDGGESAKSLNRPGLQRLMGLVNGGKVQAVIVAKLDRLTRSVKDLCGLLELFEKRKVALISVAEALDTGSAWSLRSWVQSANGSARPSANEPATRCVTSAATASAWGTSSSVTGCARTNGIWNLTPPSRLR